MAPATRQMPHIHQFMNPLAKRSLTNQGRILQSIRNLKESSSLTSNEMSSCRIAVISRVVDWFLANFAVEKSVAFYLRDQLYTIVTYDLYLLCIECVIDVICVEREMLKEL